MLCEHLDPNFLSFEKLILHAVLFSYDMVRSLSLLCVQVLILLLQDTEFPGVVARPIGEFRSNADYQYQLLRCNVDLLKIIQLGLTFMNEQGEYPPGTSTWQFNFKFNLT